MVYEHFNNHFHGYVVENCLQVLEIISELTPEQIEDKRKIQVYFKTAKSSTKVEKPFLEMFVEPTELSFDSLIRRFID
ncbi:hypothetical protein DRN46_03850 [Thermococci archaeon]|nr:MAG: hypothetical protein DRN46_03850 [Thermococci archaeon]